MAEDQAITVASLQSITVSGLTDEAAKGLAFRVAALVGELTGIDRPRPLDLRRMKRMVFAADYAAALEDEVGDSGRRVAPTREDYAVGVAKVIVLRLDGSDFEIVPVFDVNTFAVLGDNYEEMEQERKDWFHRILHMLHHELCHVHDDNKKIDAMPAATLGKVWAGAETIIGPLAEVAWSEYFANRVSCITASDAVIDETVEMFKDALLRTKPTMNDHIIAYRRNSDLDGLMALFKRHGDFLVKAAAYALGYLDGIGKTLEEVSGEAHQVLMASDFRPFWHRMHTELKAMFDKHPAGWDDSLAIYSQLSEVMQDFYDDMGLVLQSQPDGGLYVNIPFRPENSTPEMLIWAAGNG
ncbi:MAG: hypothetical protein E5X74_21555 [Mesorhizobium sp.]|uniref:hypothetical protein n=1 Tax=Mesorhizobium sp. TaxID=1871066 RepID=UPI001219C3E9|nr:hypothetical protein [Mesorhizobium sp.]TIO76172.1 MAG: hypothetical protein E5X75_15770 [Mesorhizobium sp.]TIO83126.1 MAG: hypothetical protein E5X74_21555 [Mesorhizobium sp.]